MNDSTNYAEVGDHVGFKCDIEQYAEVTKVDRRRGWDGRLQIVYTVKAGPDGFDGEYIGGMRFTEVLHSDTFED